MKSPVSGIELIEEQIEGVTLHKDPTTGGYWLRLTELKALVEAHDAHLDEVQTGETTQIHQGRFCPEDNTALQEVEFAEHSGIKMDVCPTCGGIWLDGGELSNLLDYLEDHEFGEHLKKDDHDEIGITDRVLLFLYQLTARPPLY